MDPFAGNNQDPQSLHKYLYVHNNPVNGIDPTGQFSIADVSVSMSISSVLRGIRTIGYVKAIQWATNAIISGLVGFDIIQGLKDGAMLNAGTIGIGGTLGHIKSPFGIAGNAEIVIGKDTGNFAIFVGGGLTTNNNTWSASGYVGLAFNTSSSNDYKGWCRSVNLSLGLIPSKARAYLEDQIQTFLPRLHQAFMQRSGDIGAVANSIDPQIITKASNTLTKALSETFGSKSSVTLWGGNGKAFGVTFAPGFASGGQSKMMSTSMQHYWKLLPSGTVDF